MVMHVVFWMECDQTEANEIKTMHEHSFKNDDNKNNICLNYR